jgi:hypothetical protein
MAQDRYLLEKNRVVTGEGETLWQLTFYNNVIGQIEKITVKEAPVPIMDNNQDALTIEVEDQSEKEVEVEDDTSTELSTE